MNQILEKKTDQDSAFAAARVFPTPETNLYKILNDCEYKRSFHGNLKKYNPLMAALYRIGLLPLFGVARTVMLLTTKGQKSGKMRRTPIGYFRIGGVIHLFSAWGKVTSWYKNMTAYPDEVWIQIGLRKFPVRAEILTDKDEIYRTLEQFVTESPVQARHLFGWEPGSDRMDRADFSAVIDRVLIVRFAVKPG